MGDGFGFFWCHLFDGKNVAALIAKLRKTPSLFWAPIFEPLFLCYQWSQWSTSFSSIFEPPSPEGRMVASIARRMKGFTFMYFQV
ncbi:E3 ubiquitin-protein ligase XBAT31 [Pyrus ussuriensis x Pyrus communis]|uniref:E3 ubiquitin-protein ligase XBAT31 n=1 Tax=Pyrus ussuriensis x Pyrus communis TaxID=2448454 RepID=A0A5N5F0W0_9ROSA|nr:E3 ubiquitin-protein ligase XBAT31 [Pyrus ussuriensis x Pyrus communis]